MVHTAKMFPMEKTSDNNEMKLILSGAYGRYEELLVEKARMTKAAGVQKMRYIAVFGELLTSIEEERIACMRIRRSLSFCEKGTKDGERIDGRALRARLSDEMRPYEENLRRMKRSLDGCRHLHISTGIQVQKVKRWYRLLLRRLHPDLHPDTKENPALSKLWSEVVIAFQENDLSRMMQLDLTLSGMLADEGMEELPIELSDLPQRIEQLKDDINAIEKSDPYQYRFLLDDPEAAREKGRELEAELSSYERQHERLARKLSRYLSDHHLEIVWTI